jgi:outer membrane lipoprotein-sorting protein
MRRMLFALAVLCAVPMAAAAPDAASLPAQIVAGVSRAPVLRAEFTQTKTIAALTRPLVTTGGFSYVRGAGLLWRIDQPYRATYVLNERGIVEVDSAGVARAGAGQGAGLQHVSRIFRALFEPDIALLEQYFTTVANGNAERWELTLTPRQSALRQAFKIVHVRGGRFVEEVAFDEANGDTTRLRFRDTREAAAPGDEEKRLLSQK